MAETEKEMYERLLSDRAGGDSARLGRSLLKKLLEANAEVSRLEGELEAAKSSVLPKDHVAVPQADADLLKQYRELGEPKVLKAAVERVPVLENDLKTRDHESGLRDVAGKQGWSFDVLKRLAPVGVQFIPAKVKDEKSGKDIETYRVLDKDAEGKERTRSIEQWQDDPDVKPLLPALQPSGVQRVVTREGVPVSASAGYEGSRGQEGRAGEGREQARFTGNAPIVNAAASI